MDIDRLLSSLWFRMYGFTGKAKHWRNKQNLGLRQVSQKTEEDNGKVKSLLLSNEPFFIGRYGTIELHNFLKGFRLLTGDNNPIKTMKSILFSQPECWSMGGATWDFKQMPVSFPIQTNV